MYIKKIVLENIRCFEHIEIEFDLSGKIPPWTVVVGDNAAGKTTLLRSIAIGLCDESSAAGLLKESDSGYVRFGGKRLGKIAIVLVRSLEDLRCFWGSFFLWLGWSLILGSNGWTHTITKGLRRKAVLMSC